MRVGHDRPGKGAVRTVRAGALLAVAAGLMLLATACGGSSSSGTSQEPSADAQAAAELKYGNCMRTHGITNFPEPNSQGQPQPQSGPPINLGSPQFLAAQKACAEYEGGGTNTAPGVSPQIMQELLKYVSCMRSHGVPNMPDPNSNGTLTLPTGGSVTASSPQFQSAQKACQKLFPTQGGAS
jgi:hypothetical protein